MGFNLKILKYNLSIAMALTGIYFYTNPEKIPPEVIEEVHVIKKKIIKKEIIEITDRKPASTVNATNQIKKEANNIPALFENNSPEEEAPSSKNEIDHEEILNKTSEIKKERPVLENKQVQLKKEIPKEDIKKDDQVFLGGVNKGGASVSEASTSSSSGRSIKTLHSPVVSNITDSVLEDNSYSRNLLAKDQDGDRLSYSITTSPTLGTAIVSSDGVLTYNPNLNSNGTDSFVVTVSDGTGRTATSFISLEIIPVNDTPETNDLNFTLNEDSSHVGILSGADVDDDSLIYSIISQPMGGMVVITNPTTGEYIYTPNGNFNGVDFFTYKVNDGNIDSLASTVNVNITAINDDPILDNIPNLTTQAGQLVSTSIVISDPDSSLSCLGNLTATSADAAVIPVEGIVFSGTAPNCTVSLTPTFNTSGVVSISISVNDLDPDPRTTTKSFNLTVSNPPSNPTLLSANLVENKVQLSWTAPITGSTPITYNIFRGTTSGSLSLLTTTSGTSYEDTSAVAGTEYFYQVSASNSYGNSSGYTNEVSIVKLGDFSINSLTSSGGKINLSFTASAGSNRYDIYYGTSSGVFSTTLTNQSSPKEITLSGGQTYYIKIRAINSYGYLDTTEDSVYVPENFVNSFDFNNSLTYGSNTYAEISGGMGQLKASYLVTEKTASGTGVSGSDSILDNYSSKDSNLDLVSDKVQMTSGFSGTYISKALDQHNAVVSLNSFNFLTDAPYGKEISLSAETGYGNAVTNFSNQLIALYRFNEGTYSGAVGELKDVAGSNNGKSLGTVTATNGLFNKGVVFNGLANYFEVPGSNSLDNSNKLTISTWFYPNLVDGNPRAIVSKRVVANNNASYSLFLYTGGRLFIDIDGTGDRFSSNRIFTANQWYHVVLIYDGTKPANQRAELYINGVLDKVATESSSAIPAYASNLYFGAMNLAYGTYFVGIIDETAIWKKTFTATEVTELYRRGANRIKFQIRTCMTASSFDCSSGTTDWVGPDGTSSSYFSELNNNSSPSNNSGLVGSSYYQADFSLFTGGLTSWLLTGTNATNQYVQYKAIFETDSSTYYPSLTKVAFSPISRYSVSSSVFSLASSKINFKKISQITITHSCADANSNSEDDDARYEFSFDGGYSYIAWNGSAWVSSNSFNTASTKAQINSLTAAEYDPLSSASGQDLWVRAYLTSTGTTPCGVDNIEVKGLR